MTLRTAFALRIAIEHGKAIWVAGLLVLSIGSWTVKAQALDDPPGNDSIAKWKLNDNLWDGVDDSSTNGIFIGEAVPGLSASSDTPANPDSGASILLTGGYVWQGSGYAQFATFFSPTSEEHIRPDYSYSYSSYSGSETISLWLKIPETASQLPAGQQGLPLFSGLPAGEHWTAFYHGAARNSANGLCTFVEGSDPTYPDAAQHGACRDFAIMVERASNDTSSNPIGYIRVGSPQGGGYLFQSGSCNPDVVNGAWTHVVAVYSADAYAHGFGFNVTLFVNGSMCGRGLIPKPYTDVTASKAHWFVSEELLPSSETNSSGTLSGLHHLIGWVDDVRIYGQVIGQPAVNWLKNNSGH